MMETATCRECRSPFYYDADDFKARGFLPPGICVRCQRERTARLEDCRGKVVAVTRSAVFIECDGSRESVITFPEKTEGLPINIGTRVVFRVDPLEEPVPGRLRLARHVRLEEAA